MSFIIDVKNLKKHYNNTNPPHVAVDGIDFQIETGEIFSLLGPNGAGKTTTISMLSCLLEPTAGEALIDGNSVTKHPQKVKQTIGVVPQEIALYPTISAYENLAFWGKMYGLSGSTLKERINDALEVATLTDRANDKVHTFSGGMKRRLNIAVALLHNPKVLYMDEPTVGIDPQSRRRILDSIIELNNRGMTILYTTHYMEEAQELSDRIAIMDHGQIIAIGPFDELTRLVNDVQVIQLDLDNDDQVIDQIAKEINQLPSVSQVYKDDQQLLIHTSDPQNLLPAILTQINQHHGQTKGLIIQEIDLETVFLHLTGRALRD